MTNTSLAKEIIESTTVGSLGTLTESGQPFVSMVTIAATGPATLVMLLSGLAKHTQNLNGNPKCSVLLVQQGGELGNPLEGARLTTTGVVKKLSRDEDGKARATFLEAHPDATMYADFGDFSFYQLDIDQAHLVAGFGRIETLSSDQIRG